MKLVTIYKRLIANQSIQSFKDKIYLSIMKLYLINNINEQLPVQHFQLGCDYDNLHLYDHTRSVNQYLLDKYKLNFTDFCGSKGFYLSNHEEEELVKFRLDKETLKMVYPYSRIIFSFNENLKADETATIKCRIEYYQLLYETIDDFDFYEAYFNDSEFVKNIEFQKENNCRFINDCGESVEPNLSDFSFYFSSYEKDIFCFSPFINIFLECLELDRQSIISDIKEKIDESIVVKNKGSKYLLHEEKIVGKIKKLKSTLGTKIEKKIIPEMGVNEKLYKTWSNPISKTLANAIIEHFSSEMLKKYKII